MAYERLGHIADEQAGNRNTELRAGEHEGGLLGNSQRALGCLIPLSSLGPQLRAVHGHKGKFLGHEVCVRDDDEANDYEAGQDHQNSR